METVKLRNGSEGLEPMVRVMSLTLSGLWKTNPLAFYELVQVCRNPNHEIFGNLGNALRQTRLMEADGYIRPEIKDIVLSSVEGDGLEMKLVSPIAVITPADLMGRRFSSVRGDLDDYEMFKIVRQTANLFFEEKYCTPRPGHRDLNVPWLEDRRLSASGNPYYNQTASGIFWEMYYGIPGSLWTPWGQYGFAGSGSGSWEANWPEIMERLGAVLYLPQKQTTMGSFGPVYALTRLDGQPLPEAVELNRDAFASYEEIHASWDKHTKRYNQERAGEVTTIQNTRREIDQEIEKHEQEREQAIKNKAVHEQRMAALEKANAARAEKAKTQRRELVREIVKTMRKYAGPLARRMGRPSVKVHCKVGDTVQVDLGLSFPVRCTVLAVRPQYGRLMFGYVKLNPIVKLDTGTSIREVDAAKIVEVVNRPEYERGPENIYTDWHKGFQHDVAEYLKSVRREHPDMKWPIGWYPQHYAEDITVTKGEFNGPLKSIAMQCLAKLPFDVKFPIDPNRLRELFFKQRPGLISYHGWADVWVTVRRKPFEAWIRRNWSKILYTRRAHAKMMDFRNDRKFLAGFCETLMDRSITDLRKLLSEIEKKGQGLIPLTDGDFVTISN